MSSKDLWVGKPPRRGNEEDVLKLMQDNPHDTFNSEEIAVLLDGRHAESISGCLSILHRTEWIIRVSQGRYQVADPPPVENTRRRIEPAYKKTPRQSHGHSRESYRRENGRRIYNEDIPVAGAMRKFVQLTNDQNGRMIMQDEETKALFRMEPLD